VRNDTSILLPTATIDLFLKDKPTIDAARALSSDWRFARVSVRVHEGDVASAIAFYASNPSPDMILVETDTTDDRFIEALSDLSSRCDEKTSAVVIGPVNDVNLYRSLTAMGVSDYLVRPVPQETLSEVIAGSLIEKLGASGSKMIAVIGAKGGAGASSMAQVLALTSSLKMGQKTFLFDTACGWSSMPVTMGFEPAFSINEAMRAVLANDSESFRRMVFPINDKLHVLATGTEPMLDTVIQSQAYEELLNLTLASYPVVIADLSIAAPQVKKAMMARAHMTAVVAIPTLASLRSARTLIQEIQKVTGNDAQRMRLIINMTGYMPSMEISKKDIVTAMDMTPDVMIPYDQKLFMAIENEGRNLNEDKGGEAIMSLLLPLLQAVIGKDGVQAQTIAGDSAFGLGSLMNKFKLKK
jgi:pilus assembly protein CpaE